MNAGTKLDIGTHPTDMSVESKTTQLTTHSEDTYQFDEASQAACDIFKREIDLLNQQLDQVPENYPYCCSSIACADASSAICCVSCLALGIAAPFFVLPAKIASALAMTAVDAKFIMGLGSAVSGAASCCSGVTGLNERYHVARLQEKECHLKLEQMDRVRSLINFIQSPECKKFCVDNRCKDLTARLQNPTFIIDMQIHLLTQEILADQPNSPDGDMGDLISGKSEKLAVLNALQDKKKLLSEELAHLVKIPSTNNAHA